jgi:hypothetical protein
MTLESTTLMRKNLCVLNEYFVEGKNNTVVCMDKDANMNISILHNIIWYEMNIAGESTYVDFFVNDKTYIRVFICRTVLLVY